jgi:putative membrane protein
MLGTLLSIILVLILAAIVIIIVSKLGLGLEVDGFGSAFIAAAAIAIIGGIILWLLDVLGISIGGGFLGAIINLIIAAVVLILSARFVKGMRVNGFVGAIVAAIGIAIVTFLVNWVLSLFL